MSPTVRKRTESSSTASPGARRRELRHRHQRAAAAHDRAPVREVDRRHLEPLARDVLPHVELGPVGDREHAHVLALVDARVVEVPQLRPLVLRIPLAELVAEREHALLRARLLLVAPRAADAGVEARTPRSRRAASPTGACCGTPVGCFSTTRPARDRVLHRAHDEPLAAAPPRADRGTRSPRGSCGRCRCAAAGRGSARGGTPSPRGAGGRCESLPPENSSAGLRALPGDLAQDVDRLRLEPVEVREGSRGLRRDGHPRVVSVRAAPPGWRRRIRDSGHPR